MIANGEVENPRAGISLVSKDVVKASKNMADSEEDERAHLSHLNSVKEERSGRTTEVREVDYQHRSNLGGRGNTPAGGNRTPTSACS